MNEARPFASLSSGLLARKGAAQPAMRPQGFGGQGFEDLGWNDMGGHEPVEDGADDLPEHVPSSIAALTPAPKPLRQDEEPEVVAQQRAIAESFEAESRGSRQSKRLSKSRPRPRRRRCASRRRPRSCRCRSAREPRRRPGPQGRLHAAARRRAPSAPAPRHRGHRPLGAADRAERARRTARRHSRNRGAGRARARRQGQAELIQQEADDDEPDRFQVRRLHASSSR